ncbi:sulfur carrier protein ThiS adenylyltransferase ThiF [Thermodesulfobacteriota bacterium]
MLLINETEFPYTPESRLIDFVAEVKPGADLFIINGFPVDPETLLQDNDKCWLIKRGEIPTESEMHHMLYARHTPGVHEKVKEAAVGIMGLGGLGSQVAVALARIGVGRLLLADFDLVEPSNLNRQQYFIDQIGLKKTAAMKANLVRINPYVLVDIIDTRLTEDSIPKHFKSVDVLAECFDSAEMKAAALRAAMTGLSGTGYVGSSGLAGYGPNNMISTRKLYPGIYLVGDGCSAAGPGTGLMAPRVGIAAHHQANKILQLLLE